MIPIEAHRLKLVVSSSCNTLYITREVFVLCDCDVFVASLLTSVFAGGTALPYYIVDTLKGHLPLLN